MLNENGFQRKTYSDLVDDMEDKAREQFGEDVNTSSRTPLGIILRIFAWFLSGLWDVSERVYNSGFVSKSEGVQLDRLGSNNGILREPASESYVTLSFTGEPGHVVEEQTQFATESDIYFEVLEAVQLNSKGEGTAQAISLEKGIDNNVAANTITIQAEPSENIFTVTNPEKSAGGSDIETDSEFRVRIKRSIEGSSASTNSGIIAALLGVSGVRSANIVANNTMNEDGDGNPPKSIHAYVLGGTKDDVAQALFDSVAAGIETVGGQTVTITDASGLAHDVKFDFAKEVKVYVQLDLKTNPSFPVDGEKQIKNNIVYKIGGIDENGSFFTGSQMGDDVILSQLFNAVYQVDGVTDVTIQIGKDAASLGQSNITIEPKEVAQVHFSEIVVNLT
ncbi:baseplate J/gp47 family protein [Bacillus atrophaeus]|uniref:baseplate J/gp47 family protein n=1 Tax=Bacillus atrophaeus TaxID=1452 RepID=UPI002281DDC4|nr:baseplate J/gp47 family protein [Bacillus atrophaeus]MCY8813686.1 baseplate J/gp47 family protein [Bacillus atrophaeus]MCY8820241.1 baseplate J/gp47 family protein [Bacillus atrophaeus]MCY8828635.1 baseplate J/gp47 family protein [Bacillus atrophaeus]MCY8832722.1 baseplate J/gp47 family protein [Bacillus atrophaeus]MEC0749744.1 baseplate J/gp47 family protein [Bacillus atrophaeus]